jgi:hypothetical protein
VSGLLRRYAPRNDEGGRKRGIIRAWGYIKLFLRREETPRRFPYEEKQVLHCNWLGMTLGTIVRAGAYRTADSTQALSRQFPFRLMVWRTGRRRSPPFDASVFSRFRAGASTLNSRSKPFVLCRSFPSFPFPTVPLYRPLICGPPNGVRFSSFCTGFSMENGSLSSLLLEK